MGLLVPKHLPGFGLTLIAILFAYLLFRVYGWFYHQNRFDLMNIPRN